MRKLLMSALAVLATGAFAQFDLTVPGGTITYCDSHATHPGTKAFDNGGTVDGSRWLAFKSALPNAWVRYQFPTATCVAGYKVFGFSSSNTGLARDPKSWTFEGSNDGTSWTLLDTQTNQINWTSLQTRSFYFDNDANYAQYRFTITANNGGDYAGLLELEFYGNPNTPGVPVVSATTATSTVATKATLNAELLMGGTADITFHWGLSPGVWSGSRTLQDIDPVNVSVEITGLDLYRTYYWTVYAENPNGSAWAPSTNSFASATGSDLTSPNGIISGCSSLSGYGPQKAFDNGGSVETSRWMPFVTNFPNAYVQYQFADGPYQIRAYRVTGLITADFATRGPKEWTFSGSTNGTDWTVIDAQVGQTGWLEGQQRTFAVSPADSYDYYRFNIITNNGAINYSGALELEFFGFPGYTVAPELVSEGVEQTAGGSANLKASLSAGGSAEVFAAWGNGPGSLSNTNSIGTVYTGAFLVPVSGLTPFQTYYYTIIAVNADGTDELDGAPLSFVAEGDRFTWIGSSGNWEDPTKWSQGVRAPNAPGDMVTINTIRTIALNSPSATLGGLTLSGPYAAGTVVVTNANANAQLVFDNPAGEAFINASVGGSAPYVIYPDLVLGEDVSVSATETYPVSLRGGVTGPGRLIQQSGARVHVAPVKDVVFDSVFTALSGTSYLSIGGSATTTLRGTNTVAFWGNWGGNGALATGARLILDGAGTVVTNISTSTRATWTYAGYHDASLTITNGARLVKTTTDSGPIFDGYCNRVTVTGEGSSWNFNNVEFRIHGTSNQLVLAQGGAVDKASLIVRGSQSTTAFTGTNTLWNANGTFCIGMGGSYNVAEISDGAVVSNCVLFVAGRYGYDIGGGYGNSLTVSGGARVYSTKDQSLSGGGGVGVTGKTSLTTADNTLLVTGVGSALVLGAYNFNIGYMQDNYATGGWNRVSVADHGVITNVPNLYIGRVSGTTQQSWSNSLNAASGGGVWVNNSINVGDARSTGNRIVMVGGRIAAQTLNVKTGNGISAVLGDEAPVPAQFTTSAVFEAGTYVWPALADGRRDGVGGVILTAPAIVGGGGLELSPEVDPALWRLVKTSTSLSLYGRKPALVVIVR